MDPWRRNLYEVTDPYAAAALVAAGFPLAGIEPDARAARPTRFLFDPDDRLADILTQHYNRALTVDAGLYAEAIRKLSPWSRGEPARPSPAPQRFGRRPAP
jgi:hypothetical protein